MAYDKIGRLLDDVEQLCGMLMLTATSRTVVWSRTWIADRKERLLESALLELGRHFRQDLEACQFLYITSANLEKYHNPGSDLLGPEVRVKFSNALIDIEDAGKALAVGLNTAAVFHLMRVMECGLRALSEKIGCPLQPNWGQYIQAFNDAIKRRRRRKGVSWKKDATFFNEVAGDLELIKSAWRNPTMHMERSYTAEEAELIFKAIQSFMQRIARRLNERPFRAR